MRKPRDYDAELKELNDRARKLQQRKVQQLGELVVATGADALSIDTLAGALLMVASSKDARAKEDWRASGTVFFQSARRAASGSNTSSAHGTQNDGDAPSSSGTSGA